MPAAESTKEGSRTVSLRLSMMTPDGLAVDYDESVKNDQASYDAACLKLSDRERAKVASGWDVLGRFIIETEDVGADIRTRMLRGKTWEFVGEPAKPPETPRVEKEKLNGQKREEEKSNGNVPIAPGTAGDVSTVHPCTVAAGESAAEAFLLELGELCMRRRLVLEGDGLRVVPFTMKAFRKLLAVEE